MNVSLSRNASRLNPRTAQAREHSAWSSGDYAVVGSALQTVGEELCETLNLFQDGRVLDVAVGNTHASMAAARRWCDVTSTDLAPDLSKRRRGDAENLGVRFIEADAEALPFGDQTFDAVISAFGAMFSPDQERASSEMIRVCRRGCPVGLANWTSEGFIGQVFAAAGSPQAPFLWGSEDRLQELFGVYGRIEATRKHVTFRHKSPADWVEKFRAAYAPVMKTFANLDANRQRALRGELVDIIGRYNEATDGTMSVCAEYLEVVVMRR